MDSLPSFFAGLNLNSPSSKEGIHSGSSSSTHTYSNINTENDDDNENGLPTFSSLHIDSKNNFSPSSSSSSSSFHHNEFTNKDAFSFGISTPSSHKGTKKIIKNSTGKSTGTPVIISVPLPTLPTTNSSSSNGNNSNSTFGSTLPSERIASPDITFTRIPHANPTPSSSSSLPPKIVSSNIPSVSSTSYSHTSTILPSSDYNGVSSSSSYSSTPSTVTNSLHPPITIPANPYDSNTVHFHETNIPSPLFPHSIHIPSYPKFPSSSSSSTIDADSPDSSMDYSPLPIPKSSQATTQRPNNINNNASSNTFPSSTSFTDTSASEFAFSFGKTPPKKDSNVPKKPIAKDTSSSNNSSNSQTTFSSSFSNDNSSAWSPMVPNIPSSLPPSTMFPTINATPPPSVPSPSSFDSPTSSFTFSPGFLNKKSDSSTKKKFPKKATVAGVTPPTVPGPVTTETSYSPSVDTVPSTTSNSTAPKLTPIKATFTSNISPPSTPSDASPSVKRVSYEELISTARSAFTNQDFALAHKKFTDALAIKSNDAMSLSNRAACAMMLGRHDEAIVDCSRATDVDASYSPAYLRCSRAYLALGEINAAMEQAEAAEVAALNTGGNSGAKHREQARTLIDIIKTIISAENNADNAIRRKAWGQALDTIALAVSAHNEARNSLRGIMLKARALVGLRKYQEATDLCSETLPPQLEGANEFLACRPRPSSTAMNAAIIFAHAAWCTEDTDRAVRILAAVLRINTNHNTALRLQKRIEYCEMNRKAGNEKYRNGDYRKSIELYTIAITAATKVIPNDDDDEEDDQVEEDKDETGDTMQEIKYGSAGIPCYPARANLFANRAAAYMALTEYDSAINDCTSALDDVSMHLKARLRRARIYTVSTKFTLAFTDYRAVLTSLRSGQVGIPVGGKLDVNIENIQKEYDEANRTYRLEQEEEKRRKQEEEKRRRQQQQQQQSRYTSYRYSSQYGEFDEEEEEEEEEEDDSNYGWYQRNFTSHRSTGSSSNTGGRTKPQQPYSNNQQSNTRSTYANNTSSHRNSNKSTGARYVPPPIPPCPPDYYSILGIDRNFNETILKKAYRLKALSTHPDKPGGSEEAFKKVGEAFAVLSDSTRRLTHDADVEDWKRKYGGRR